ncbi:amidohydrolase [Haloimpatiens sp. FM7315]|uniref:amidohydrolase n=1 Tax=Haloimpatiens sp. FM7315 TaxID=3298609 RepID=UPI0035A276C2
MDLLIKNATIITMDEDNTIINNGYVLIKDNIIKEVSKGDYKGELLNLKVIKGEGFCVMPGIINCHTHSAMTLLRGYGEGLPLMRWLSEKIWPVEAKLKEKHIEMGTMLACIEMLRSGTTAFNDMYFMQREVKKVAVDTGMRAVLGLPIIGENWEKQIEYSLELLNEIRKENRENINMMFAPHAPYTLNFEALKSISEVAKRENKGIHIHIAETKDELNTIKDKYNMTPCELLEKSGVLDVNVLGAHCVHLSESDMEIIKGKKVNPVYNPQSNMKLASGIAPVAKLLELGVNVCLGTDGASSNNNLNMFEEMETGALLQKLKYEDATKLSAYNVMKMATVNGAKALGFEKLGEIKEGFKADMIMLNLNKPNMIPNYDICSNIAFSANGSEVEYVIINGKIIMEKGAFLNIDEEKVLFECNKLCKEFI